MYFIRGGIVFKDTFFLSNKIRGRRGRYRTIVGFTTTRAMPLMARCT
jgi:hypothetical protein